MAKYMSAFIVPVPKSKMKVYKAAAAKSAKLWIKNGALEYVEAIGDGLSKGKTTSFPRSVKLKSSETVVFGYATFKSKKHYEQVMDKLHQDPEVLKLWDSMCFDGMRMIWGSFNVFVAK